MHLGPLGNLNKKELNQRQAHRAYRKNLRLLLALTYQNQEYHQNLGYQNQEKKRKASKQSIDFFKLDDTEYDPLEPDTDFNPLDTDYNKRDPDFRLSVEQVAGRKQEFQAGRHSYYAPPRRKRRKTAQELTEEMFLQKFHVMAEQDDGMDIEEKAKQMVEINKEIQALWDKFKGTERMQSLRRKDSTLDDFLEELEAINQEMYAEMNRTFWKQENEHDKEEIT